MWTSFSTGYQWSTDRHRDLLVSPYSCLKSAQSYYFYSFPQRISTSIFLINTFLQTTLQKKAKILWWFKNKPYLCIAKAIDTRRHLSNSSKLDCPRFARALHPSNIVELKNNGMNNIESSKGEIVMYQPDETIRLEVRMDEETVWLTQQQMAELFQKDQSVVARHINNAFKEGELDENSNMHFLHNTRYKYRPTKVYSLDVTIRGTGLWFFLKINDLSPRSLCSCCKTDAKSLLFAEMQPIFAILFAKIPIISVKSLSLQNKIRIIRI